MRILVLGGTGTIGRPLVKFLSENKEHSVFYVSRNGGGRSKKLYIYRATFSITNF